MQYKDILGWNNDHNQPSWMVIFGESFGSNFNFLENGGDFGGSRFELY